MFLDLQVCVDVENTICDDPNTPNPPFTAFRSKRAAEDEPALLTSQSHGPVNLAATVGLPALVGAVARPAVATIQHPCHQVENQNVEINSPCFRKPLTQKSI